jgi:hypothetical protein
VSSWGVLGRRSAWLVKPPLAKRDRGLSLTHKSFRASILEKCIPTVCSGRMGLRKRKRTGCEHWPTTMRRIAPIKNSTHKFKTLSQLATLELMWKFQGDLPHRYRLHNSPFRANASWPHPGPLTPTAFHSSLSRIKTSRLESLDWAREGPLTSSPSPVPAQGVYP